ncbi:MAG: phosphoadenylyl-sulfate reductase [Hyphomicrobiaceae bacterium]|nr:phosphoadenylyl-sulfate reductase [Hyphomicrobiaceae bacterium]
MEHVDLRTAELASSAFAASGSETGSLPAGATELAVTADRQERHAAIVEAVLAGNAIAVPFAKFNDGRGFSLARLLRSEHGFRGEIRATGHVIPDQALHLLRSGFDTAEISDADKLPHWQQALSSYNGNYQTAARNPLALRRQAALKQSGENKAAELGKQLAASGDLVERIRIIAKAVPGRLSFSTSLGKEDQAILHAIHEAGIEADIFTLDTHKHFKETLETLKRSEEHYGLTIRVITPNQDDLRELMARDGEEGFRASVAGRKACCMIRKVLPLNRTLRGSAGWLTGLRREQSAERAAVDFASWDGSLNLLKLSPLADWTEEQLEAYVSENNVPVNPLHAEGYVSIGCEPCTRAIAPGEDPRAGRWWWESMDGKECGLHIGGERLLDKVA